ncbi:MAG: response regulator [Treponema sp.]|nr:response regulator [Treponema sp.]
MKTVLIVDATPMLQEFITEKLSAENVDVEIADGQRDALPKFLSVLPDLVIINVENSVSDTIEFLDKKQSDPNGKKIPVIMAGPEIDHDEASDLVQYNVIKYFTRPIKFDLFFDAIGRVLHMPFSIDQTPCVLDMHLNKNIIFIEIAKGLNREKISLLKYKLRELIEANQLSLPKLILMMSDLSLSYVDGLNLEYLLDNIIADSRILRRNIKILSMDEFVSDFIEGHPVYDGIQVLQDLSKVITSFVGETSDSVENLITDKVLSYTPEDSQKSLAIRFNSDSDSDSQNTSESQLKIAVVYNDPVVLKHLKNILETIGEVKEYASSKEFLSQILVQKFDLAVCGMRMAEITGLDILHVLVEKKIDLPVIIYSKLIQKEIIMQSLKLGASSYLINPQPAEVIVQKTLEIINARKH